MSNKISEFKYAMLDGFIRGLLLYILGEYAFSKYSQYKFTHILIAATICAFISIFLSLLLSKKVERLAIFYTISQACFALFAVLIFINYMTIGVHMFPPRELGNVDGLLVFLGQGFYLLLSEPIRLVILFALFVHRKANNFTKQRHVSN